MRALTVGGATIDTIAIIDSDRIERVTMRNADTSFLLLEQGRKTEALEMSAHCGGGAVNAAVAMARLGLDVATIVKIGYDERAETLLDGLGKAGVSTRWVARDRGAPTGASVLISSHDRDAAIFTFRGANTLLAPADLHDDAFAVDLVYVANLSNESADCFPLIVERAKQHAALVAVNPGIRQISARGGTLQSCLPMIDILAINRAEADRMVSGLIARFGEGGPSLELLPGERPPALVARGLAGGGFEMSLSAFIRALVSLGTGTVVLTDGMSGAYAGSADEILYCPTLEAEVRGTAGAGDAFASTFSAVKALGWPAEDALRAAAINAASVVGHIDTQTGLLKREEIERRLATMAAALPIRRWRLSS